MTASPETTIEAEVEAVERLVHRAKKKRIRPLRPKTEHQRTYWVWAAMIARCTNPKSSQYQDYGGRGITVCERWRVSKNFFEDMGVRPSQAHTLERRINSKGYEASNCFWATRGVNNKNKRLYRCNQLGVAGVNQVGDKFIARIRVNTKMVHLGRFKTLSEAAHARAEAEVRYGFSFEHGKPS